MTAARIIALIALASLTGLAVVGFVSGDKRYTNVALAIFIVEHFCVIVRILWPRFVSRNPEYNMKLARAAGWLR